MAQGQNWNKLLCLATFMYNTFNTPNLCNHSPFELHIWKTTQNLTRFGNRPQYKGIWNILGLLHTAKQEVILFTKCVTEFSV